MTMSSKYDLGILTGGQAKQVVGFGSGRSAPATAVADEDGDDFVCLASPEVQSKESTVC